MEIGNIKFKAKRLDNGEWIIGSFVVMKIPALSKTTIGIVAAGGATLHEVDPSTVCQFTGLTDCEGNELYEHDVIKNYPFIPSEIVWSEELSGYYLTHANGKIYEKPLGYYLSLGKFIVVGSTYENTNRIER